MFWNPKGKEQSHADWERQKALRSHQNWGALSQLGKGHDGVSVGQAGDGQRTCRDNACSSSQLCLSEILSDSMSTACLRQLNADV